jgi:hypothetical protein
MILTKARIVIYDSRVVNKWRHAERHFSVINKWRHSLKRHFSVINKWRHSLKRHISVINKWRQSRHSLERHFSVISYDRNMFIIEGPVIRQSVCPWQAFPALCYVCG